MGSKGVEEEEQELEEQIKSSQIHIPTSVISRHIIDAEYTHIYIIISKILNFAWLK